MKTLKQWNSKESPSSFEQYAKPGDEIDAELYEYFLGVLPPIYHKNGVFQVSEPFSHTSEGFATYGTYQKLGKKYFYHGNLTKKQASQKY